MADTITLQGIIRDFSSVKRPDLPDSHPDFETDSFDHTKVETGIVGSVLDSKHKPIYVGGNNQNAIKSTHGSAAFAKWYADDHRATAQKPFSITLTKISGTSPTIYSYDNQAFFPIDNDLLGNEGNPHNFHFTYELNTEFTYQGGEKFTFTGDDDLWVFIDNKLVIDLGGIHTQQSATATLDDLTWVKYDPSTGRPANEKIKLTVGTTYSLRLFFAERHTTESHFRIDTSIVLTQPTATIVASDPNANELGPDAGEFTLSLDKPALTDLTLKYSVAGTAKEGVDYQPIGSSVVLPKGATSAKLPVMPIVDQLAEGPETVVVTLSGGSGYQVGTPSSATVTIADNPPPVATIVATDPQASEIGLDPGQFTITLDKIASTNLTVGYSVAGTATEGADYQPIGRSVLIPQGQRSAVIPVKPLADQLPEAPETVIATLLSGTGYQLGTGMTATVTIADNPPPVATIVATDPQASEIGLDPGQFTILLDRVAITNLTISYSVAGTATEGTDYQPIGRSVVIPQGQNSAIIPVRPLADQLAEAPETVVATLLAGAAYQLGASVTATVTIADNPPVVIPIATLFASDPVATKPEAGQSPTDLGEFTISLSKPAPKRMVMNFTVAGSARETVDCQPMPRNATIEAGQSQVKIPVVPIAPQRLGTAETDVIATLQASDGCQLGAQITGRVVIKLGSVVVIGPR
jgi:fibro-slime domain-containing protein